MDKYPESPPKKCHIRKQPNTLTHAQYSKEKMKKTGEHILVENTYQEEPEEYNVQMMSERVSEPQRFSSSKRGKEVMKRTQSSGVLPMRSKAKPETLGDMVTKAYQTQTTIYKSLESINNRIIKENQKSPLTHRRLSSLIQISNFPAISKSAKSYKEIASQLL